MSGVPLPSGDGPALWGGIECTVARLGDTWRNQIDEIGLELGPAQFEQIASLGIRTLRFPVIWETVSPEHPDECDWRWHDERLPRMRELGIRPIAGLIHHGSGPHYTDLLDRRFPVLLARHAERVARRYPWIDAYTPVNEPLTTARFSALYGMWYPHARDERLFLRALVNQCRAVVLSMQAIRRINPAAQLVQTDDFGKVFATPTLQYQADFENERRWLSYDLLLGLVNSTHSGYSRFIEAGIDAEELAFFQREHCAPDIIGINHYLTSERYLDERLDDYPECFHGGNGRHCYADVEAVRMEHLPPGSTGPEARLREVWERYRRPFAVTEAHHGCSRDEQVRWLRDVWQAASKLKMEGADVCAVTVWSLYGAMDWNSLLTRREGSYEPGAFDTRSRPPRPTAIAHVARSLSRGKTGEHAVLDAPGWWQRDDRYYLPVVRTAKLAASAACDRRILVTGATGTLGRAFSRVCTRRGLAHLLLSRQEMDIAEAQSVERVLQRHRPWAVINAAGYVRVPDAEREQARCFRENAAGAAVLAAACAKLEIPFVSFSSDLVFDGRLGRAYVESDPVQPVCTYGRSKAEAEQQVLAAWERALVIRTSAFFGPWDPHNFVYKVIADLAAGRRVEIDNNVKVSPTYVPDLVHATLDLLIDGERGVWHLANRGAVSWFELALHAAREARLDTQLLSPAANNEVAVTALCSERGDLLPPCDSALGRYFRECELDWRNHWKRRA